MMRRKVKVRNLPDLTFLLIIFSLLFFGIIMVYDSSVVYAHDLFDGKYYFLILQLFWVLVSLTVAFVVSRIDYHIWEKQTVPILAASLVFLVLLALHRFLPEQILNFYETFVPQLNGAYRWFYFNPKPLPPLPVLGRIGFQPSEFAKIALSIYLSSLLAARKRRSRGFFQFLLMTGLVGGLVVAQPDFGTATIIVSVSVLIYFISGASVRNLAVIGATLSILAVSFILSSDYRRQRLMTYLRPSQSETLTSRYQINQILIALGSGGLTGLGFGKSVQKYGYIPEVSTDSIFSVVGEEFGFLGTLLMTLLFFLLIYRGIWIASRLPDEFGRLLCVGIVGFIGFQTFINLFSMTHLTPLTGVPLPLISYGGSSLVVNLFALGIVLNMSRQMDSGRSGR